MLTNEEIEAYLLESGRDFTPLQENMWLIHEENHPEQIVVCRMPPIITFRIKIMEIPEGEDRNKLFERLLRLNGTEMVSGAYGIEENNVILVDTLQDENLDLNEFQASLDGLSLAVSMHQQQLTHI